MRRSHLISIFLVVFIDLLGFGLILPLLPYFAGEYGATDAIVGLLVASYALAQLIGAPLLGRLSDRLGRRPILMLSIAGTALSFLLLALADPIGRALAGAWSADPTAAPGAAVLAVMFLSRFAAGLAGGNITVAQAYISDVTTPENRARGLGIIGAAFGLGFILGPAIGGALSRWGYDAPAFAAAGLATANLAAVLFLLPESLTPAHRAELARRPRALISARAMLQSLTQPRVGSLFSIRLFTALAAALFQTMFTLWSKERLGLSAQATAYLLAYVGLLSVIVQAGLIGPLTRRFSEHRLILASTAILGASLLAWAFTPSVPLLLLVLAPLAFSTGVLNTVVNSAITRAVEPAEIGGALGIATSLESLSRVVSPTAGGLLIQGVGTWAPGVAAAAIMGATVAYTRRRLASRPDPAAALAAEPPAVGQDGRQEHPAAHPQQADER